MNINPDLAGMDSGIPPTQNALRLYGQDGSTDEFPILKAFQEYIDAEQAKARKRLTMVAVFFAALMFVVIAVFVTLLVTSTDRNQKLNDRLIEYAMQDRNRPPAQPVVVQSPAQPDNSAILRLTEKLEQMQRDLIAKEQKMAEAQREESAAKASARESAKPETPKGATPQELEISRLKALLAEKDKQAAEEKARLRELELEAYRRKHYPELYAPQPEQTKQKPKPKAKGGDDLDELIQEIDENSAISYFDDAPKTQAPQAKKSLETPSPSATLPSKNGVYEIPVNVQGTRRSWRIPQN